MKKIIISRLKIMNRLLQEESEGVNTAVDETEGEYVLASESRSEPTAIGSAIFLTVLVLVLCILTLQAIAWWRVSKRSTTAVKFVLFLSMVLVSDTSGFFIHSYVAIILIQMLTTAVFSFAGDMYLRLLFALSILAQYLSLCTLSILLKYLRHNTAIAMRRKVRWLLYPLHAIYGILFMLGLTSDLGATCTTSTVLPAVFYLKDLCYFIYFAVLLGLKYNNFLLDWNNAGQKQLRMKDIEN